MGVVETKKFPEMDTKGALNSLFLFRFPLPYEKLVCSGVKPRHPMFQRKNKFLRGPTNGVKLNIGFSIRKIAVRFISLLKIEKE